jgi:hypothetical protein
LPAPPLNDGYAVTLADNLQRTDFEQGESRQRNIFRSGATQYSITWPMTPQQFDIFKGVLRWILCDGNGWFTMPVFDGQDYVTRKVRFIKQPMAPKRDGGEWMTSAIVETMDDIAPDQTSTIAALLTFGSGETVQDFVARFHDAVHVSLPAAVLP